MIEYYGVIPSFMWINTDNIRAYSSKDFQKLYPNIYNKKYLKIRAKMIKKRLNKLYGYPNKRKEVTYEEEV